MSLEEVASGYALVLLNASLPHWKLECGGWCMQHNDC